MPQQLTRDQIESRMEMYSEAYEHLEMEVGDTPEEIIQARFVANHIRKMAENWYKHIIPRD